VCSSDLPFIDAIPNPGVGNMATPADWIAFAYKKAQEYTALIKQNQAQCYKEGDFTSVAFEEWYLLEQARVENVLFDLQQQISRAGSNAALLIVDASLKAK
jgi:ferritin